MATHAMIQLTNSEKPMWTQILRSAKTRLGDQPGQVGTTHRSDVYETRQRIGHIITSSPIAIGSETLTNLVWLSTSRALGTKAPSRIPTAMARMIHSASSLSSHPSGLSAMMFASGAFAVLLRSANANQ